MKDLVSTHFNSRNLNCHLFQELQVGDTSSPNNVDECWWIFWNFQKIMWQIFGLMFLKDRYTKKFGLMFLKFLVLCS